MATVPTADALGLGRNVKTSADTTPVDGPSAQLAVAAGKIHADQLGQVGTSIASVVAPINDAMIGIKKREDAIDRARKTTQFNREAEAILQGAKDTSDLSLPDSMKALNEQIAAKKNEILEAHAGTATSRTALETSFEQASAGYSAQAATEGIKIQKQVVSDMLAEQLAPITAQALKEPGKIQEYFAMWDAHLKNLEDGMDPIDEQAQRQAGRSAIVLNSVEAFTGRGNYLEAKKLIDENPAIMKELDATQQRSLVTKIQTGLTAQHKINNAGNIKVQMAEQILKRQLTQPERVKLAGLTSTGPKTEAEKIADIEASIGRSLTPEEKEVHAGLRAKPKAAEGKFQGDVGKAFSDLQLAEKRFGKGTPAYNAIAEAAEAAAKGDKPKLTEVAGVRKEFTKLSGPYIEVRDAFDKINISSKNPSPAGDLSLIIAYMKMLDPGSTVREGEFATAEQAGNVGQRVYALYSKLFTSKGRLEPTQRTDFVSRSKLLMQGYQKNHEHLENTYKKLAKSMKMNPDEVAIDFVGDRRAIIPPEDGPGDDGNPPAPVEIDLQGQPLAPQTKQVPDENRPAENKPAEVKRDPKAKIDFSQMDGPALGQMDTKGMSKANKKAMSERLKELGF
jgi:hypothetical protein